MHTLPDRKERKKKEGNLVARQLIHTYMYGRYILYLRYMGSWKLTGTTSYPSLRSVCLSICYNNTVR